MPIRPRHREVLPIMVRLQMEMPLARGFTMLTPTALLEVVVEFVVDVVAEEVVASEEELL